MNIFNKVREKINQAKTFDELEIALTDYFQAIEKLICAETKKEYGLNVDIKICFDTDKVLDEYEMDCRNWLSNLISIYSSCVEDLCNSTLLSENREKFGVKDGNFYCTLEEKQTYKTYVKNFYDIFIKED